VCEQRKHGAVVAGAGNRPGYLTVIARAAAGGVPAGSGELSPEIVEQALAQERVRRAAAGQLPQEVRGQLSDELIDELLGGRRTEAEVVGPDGLLGRLTKRLVERAMAGELSAHEAVRLAV